MHSNALQAAVHNGSKTVVRLLLKKGAEINTQGEIFCNTPQAAAYRGSEAVF
jgi:ankyrin repeat protein